jgi:hypothetical protein
LEADMVGAMSNRDRNDGYADPKAQLADLLALVGLASDNYRQQFSRLVETKIAALQAENEQLRADLRALEVKFGRLDSRFNDVASRATELTHPNLQKEDDNRHHDLARRYEQFIDHVMGRVVQDLAEPRTQALALAHMSVALFSGGHADREELAAVIREFRLSASLEDIRKVCVQAQALREDAQTLGREHAWDFQLARGPVIPARQERVLGSAIEGDQGEVAEFVVTPGYTVDGGQVILKQKVFTVAPTAPAVPTAPAAPAAPAAPPDRAGPVSTPAPANPAALVTPDAPANVAIPVPPVAPKAKKHRWYRGGEQA